ncbi:MAG: TOBE domain-containing protein, partial [Pseudomonadota bacterium]
LDALKDNGHKYSIAQVGAPLELYETPNSEFVARFIGSPAMTLLEGEIIGTGETTTIKTVQGGGTITSNVPSKPEDQGAKVNIGIRPEDAIETDAEDYAFSGEVEVEEVLGEVTLLYFKKTSPNADQVIAKLQGIHPNHRGKTIKLTADPSKVHIFRNGVSLLYR